MSISAGASLGHKLDATAAQEPIIKLNFQSNKRTRSTDDEIELNLILMCLSASFNGEYLASSDWVESLMSHCVLLKRQEIAPPHSRHIVNMFRDNRKQFPINTLITSLNPQTELHW